MFFFSILRPFGPAQASHLSQVRCNLQKAGFLGSWWRRGVVDIPEPISEMCTKEVLVMRFLEGDNLIDGIQQLGERAAKRQGLTLDDLKREMLHKFEREGYPEPYSGPSPFVIEAYCSVWKSTIVSLRRAVRHRHRHTIEQASRRWREGRRGDSGRTRRIFDFHTGTATPTARSARS